MNNLPDSNLRKAFPDLGKEYRSESEQSTWDWGKAFGQSLKAGDHIALTGDLGAGKTALSKGISAGLGYSGEVRSPSYALVHEYEGPISIYHIDLYRLPEQADLHEIGMDHYFGPEGVCLVEWPERLGDPSSPLFRFWIDLQASPQQEDVRLIRLFGPRQNL